MISPRAGFTALAVVVVTAIGTTSHAKTIKIAVVQTVIEGTLTGNEAKFRRKRPRDSSTICRIRRAW